MRISVEPAHHLPVAIVEAAHTHAAFAFTRFTPHIRSVTVRIADSNEPSGGAGQRCSVTVRLVHRDQDVVVESADADRLSAVARTMTRAARAVARRLDRRRSWRRLTGIA